MSLVCCGLRSQTPPGLLAVWPGELRGAARGVLEAPQSFRLLVCVSSAPPQTFQFVFLSADRAYWFLVSFKSLFGSQHLRVSHKKYFAQR